MKLGRFAEVIFKAEKLGSFCRETPSEFDGPFASKLAADGFVFGSFLASVLVFSMTSWVRPVINAFEARGSGSFFRFAK